MTGQSYYPCTRHKKPLQMEHLGTYRNREVWYCDECERVEYSPRYPVPIGELGQGLVEYALIVLLVVFVFWVAIKNTKIGNQLSESWSRIGSCLESPIGCSQP